MFSSRTSLWAVSVLTCLLVALGHGRSSAGTIMRGSKAPNQFKIYDGHLNADQKRCLRYALKQWVMYDKAAAEKKLATSNGPNRNETSSSVMTAGPRHYLDNAATTNPAKKHHLSSRCMSRFEFKQMRKIYGPTSPFHAPGQPVQDPVTNPGAWFTNDEGSATMTVKIVAKIPGYLKTVAGFMDYKLDPPAAGVPEMKKGPATLWLNQDAGKTKTRKIPRTWCYPSDTDGDGWITNMDAKCPENQLDFYQIIKHELGHWFCWWHKGSDFSLEPQYDNPFVVPGLQSPDDEDSCCPHCGAHFTDASAPRIYFASSRPGGFGGTDIWYANWDDTAGAYGPPVNLGPDVNSPSDETTPDAAAGDAWLYFASNRPGGAGGFDLYMSVRVDSLTWGPSFPLPVVNTPDDEVSPMEWADRILFASNRAGGFGDWDLYQALKNGTPTLLDPPVNLGAGVNTMFPEKDPLILDWDLDNAVIYFASGRPGGFGLFDIYRAEMTGGVWGSAVNLGPGVNSPANDTAPHLSPKNDRIFFASDRNAGAGAGWELFQSANLVPRIYTVAGHDVRNEPLDTLATPFMVYNDSFMPLVVTPFAWNEDGWTLVYDSGPFGVLPGEFSTVVVGVVVPGAASYGDTTLTGFEATAGAAIDTAYALGIVGAGPTGAGGGSPRPFATLLQNVPNPFNPGTEIRFSLAEAADVSLDIFDAAGRHVATIAGGRHEAGPHAVRWEGENARGETVASGVYFYRLRTPKVTLVRKLVLLR